MPTSRDGTLDWFRAELGDAVTAIPELSELRERLDEAYREAGRPGEMRALYHHAPGRLHCGLNVYLTAAFQRVLALPGATRCGPPPPDATVLAGNAAGAGGYARREVTVTADVDYRLDAGVPEVDEYCELRRLAGMSPRAPEAARQGLPNTLFAATLRREGRLVAMGRVLGDGGCNFEIVDVAVHPDHQRRGLGSRIMQALMDHIHATAPVSAYVSLIADGDSPALYRQFGFEPVAPESIGMALRIR